MSSCSRDLVRWPNTLLCGIKELGVGHHFSQYQMSLMVKVIFVDTILIRKAFSAFYKSMTHARILQEGCGKFLWKAFHSWLSKIILLYRIKYLNKYSDVTDERVCFYLLCSALGSLILPCLPVRLCGCGIIASPHLKEVEHNSQWCVMLLYLLLWCYIHCTTNKGTSLLGCCRNGLVRWNYGLHFFSCCNQLKMASLSV